ncbi:hypothetical protein INT45_011916 [Circinella minor]|uniref:Uncharacterized protein n=1 Tax=Circinella minor TaxID=1195481 RepID=A0A8H7VHY3_9FUNG|nr:hypothetical protein INT45_011916 [Circinella minor]
MKAVRFNTEDLETIVPTYSDVDYDRGSFSDQFQKKESPSSTPQQKQHYIKQGLFQQQQQSKNTFNKKSITTNRRPFITPLDLSGVPNACRRAPAPIGHQVLVVRKVSSLMIH